MAKGNTTYVNPVIVAPETVEEEMTVDLSWLSETEGKRDSKVRPHLRLDQD